MTPRFVLSLALGVAFFTGCPGPATPRAATRTPRRAAPASAGPTGEQRFKSSCAACHGPDARGLPNIGKDLVAGEFTRTQSDDELLAFIKRGRDAADPLNTTKVAMPPKGGNPALDDADLRSIIAHLRTLQQQTSP
jgi:mono/diheme cytochrome c family protein